MRSTLSDREAHHRVRIDPPSHYSIDECPRATYEDRMIFSRWRSRTAPQAPPKQLARIPDGQVVYAVGDIHGRLDLLQRAADAIARDADTLSSVQPVTIFIGDYIDRGPSSR